MTKTLDLGGYSRACGPAALAELVRVDRERAAAMLAEIDPGHPARKPGFTKISTMVKALERAGLTAVEPMSDQPDLQLPRKPTLAQWLREYTVGTYLVLAAHHYVVVRHGQVVADNGTRPMRGRVVRAVRVTDPNRPDGSDDQPIWPVCKCGCGSNVQIGRAYKAGHDARHLSVLASAVSNGQIGIEAALAQLEHSDKLRDKLTARLTKRGILS